MEGNYRGQDQMGGGGGGVSCPCRACISAKVAKRPSVLSGLPVECWAAGRGREGSGKRETGICCYSLLQPPAILRRAGGGGDAVFTWSSLD